MRVLITGSTGFIGSHLAHALQARGHVVIAAGRRALPGFAHVAADFQRDVQPGDWLARLQDIDVVINAVGILREAGSQSFDALHHRAPRALFDAAVASGVSRIIQISALGADTGISNYFRSKHLADEALAATSADWTIVQPSLVYGEGGTSAALFTFLASLPLLPLPGNGTQLVQPVHIDDLTLAVTMLCERAVLPRQRVAIVGPEPMTLRAMLTQLRHGLGLGAPRFLPIPLGIMALGARIAAMHPRSLLDQQTLSMLQSGNIAAADATTRLLGRKPRPVREFIAAPLRDVTLTQAQLRWLLPMLRVSIALVWLWTAITSAWLFPAAESFVLLERSGVPRAWAPLMLCGAIALDFIFGMATLLCSRARLLWLAQIALILLYTVIISVRLPEFWLHPYGPILKNLPMLAALYLLYVLERPRWNT